MSKRKAAAPNDNGKDGPVEENEVDYTLYMSRVLISLRAKSPITKADLGLILQDTADDFDFDALWDLLQKSVYTRYDEASDKVSFEHELHNVNGQNLKEFIDKRRKGVSREELLSFNKDLLQGPINELLRSASVLPYLGWTGSNRKCLLMFPRGTDFKVQLSGTVSGKTDSKILETTHDLRSEVRRGDAIVIDGQVYRVSSEESNLKDLTLKELRELISELGADPETMEERDQLEIKVHELMNDTSVKRAAKRTIENVELLERLNEFSSSSYKDPSKKPVLYKFNFDAKHLPLDRPLKSSVDGLVIYKFGCSNDIREAYWKVAENSANNYSLKDSGRLDNKISEMRLMSEDLLEGLNQNSLERQERRAKQMAESAARGSQAKRQRRTFPRKITNVHMLDKE